ncbi:MAG: sugar transferase [Bacteroidetes bacterium]|nr:sugar transferase [Bacteroidota bacterium]MBU1718025.1 sugar transferase [Bacteroidota bacterium]
MKKRLFDIFFSFVGLAILLPVFVVFSLMIVFDSRGGIFFRQIRVGKNEKDFRLWKFRTMYGGSEIKGLLTVGAKDSRITRTGYFLRRYKLDELPQLINVFCGTMSFVGPRPEVRKYTDQYDPEQKRVLLIKPGITDFASLEYANENEILGKTDDPEKTYTQEIMPAKLALNLKYINEMSLTTDVKIILRTIRRIFL